MTQLTITSKRDIEDVCSCELIKFRQEFWKKKEEYLEKYIIITKELKRRKVIK